MLDRLIRYLFIFGVVLGLAGQGVASASTPCMAMMQRQASAMVGMSDCMAGQDKPDKQSTPCKEMMPGCLAMSGCAVLAALDGPTAAVHEPLFVATAASWPATSVLIGRNIAPDPDPPSFFG